MNIEDARMWWHKRRSDIPDDQAIGFPFDEVARLDTSRDYLLKENAALAEQLRERDSMVNSLDAEAERLTVKAEAMRLVLAPLSVKADISEEKLLSLLAEAEQAVKGALQP